MAIDIRATVTCSLGTLISGSISDDYIQGSGLVKTRGSVEISGTITPAIGTVVTFAYAKGGVTRSIPRKLRVLSSFADPFRRTTKVELGCKLTYKADLREPLNWDAFNDPENRDIPKADAEIVVLPIYASSVMGQCLAKLGLAASGAALTNAFSVESFDFSAGYVQVLGDLLVSEGYFGYLDENEVLQIRSLNVDGGTGPVFTSADIVDVGSIGVGQLPGEAVTVSYSTLILKVPEEDPEAGGGGGEGGGGEEPPAETPGGIPSSTTTPATPEEAAAQAIIDEKRNWERQETYGSPEEYYIPYTAIINNIETRLVAVFTGTTSTISETKYETIRFNVPPRATFPADKEQLVLIGSIGQLPIYQLIDTTGQLPVYMSAGNTAFLTPEQQTEFEANPTSVLEEVWADAELYDYISDGSDQWVLLPSGWTLNPPTYQEQFESNPEAILSEIWPDAELYDFVADSADQWVYLSSGWTLNPPTYAEQYDEDPIAVLNEIWPGPSIYDYIADGNDKWIHTGSGNWYHDKKALEADELYEEKEVPVLRTTEEYGPLIAIASSVANDYLSNGFTFNNKQVLISRTEQTFDYDTYGNQIKTETSKYENKIKIASASDIRWADGEEAINLSYAGLKGTTLTELTVATSELQSGFTRETTSTYLKHIFTQNGQQALANAAQQAQSISDMVDIILWIIDSGLVHGQTTVTVSKTGTITSQERPPAPTRAQAAFAKNTPTENEKQIKQESTSAASDTATSGESNEATPDPDNGYRVESSSQLALSIGSPTAERRIEFSLPYAPDDRFVKSANNNYYSFKSDAKAKAAAFGRVQNRLLLGNRSGMNLQLAPERLPAAPFDPLYVQANGLTALYRANGTSWAFDSNGIVCSIDALFWGAVGGTGTFWFPVAPGITTLPTTPAVVDGQMNATTVVLPYNETALYTSRVRLITSVTKFSYSLELLTEVPPLVTKLQAQVFNVTLLAAAAGSFAITGQAAALVRRYRLQAAATSFAATGFSAGSIRDYAIGTNAGNFTAEGQPAALRVDRAPLVAEAGSFVVTGQDAESRQGLSLLGASGAFALAGQAASLLKTYVLVAEAGTTTLTGQSSTLSYTQAQSSVLLYTGTAATLSVTGAGFKPGLVLLKRRNSTADHGWFDKVRGATKYLRGSTANSEATSATTLTDFDNDGFTIGSNSTFNTSSATYVAHCLREGGAAANNTEGNVTTSCSVNSDLEWSAFTYTGVGNTTKTVGHGLSGAPDLVIIKARASEFTHWVGSPLFGTAKAYDFRATSVTTTNAVFQGFGATTLTLDSNVMSNGTTYVGWAFKAKAGVSDVALFTGTGSATYTHTLGWQPRFILMKNTTTTTGSWLLFYRASGGTGYADFIDCRTTAAEAVSTTVQITSDGFSVDVGGPGNVSGGTTQAVFWAVK